MELGTAHDVTPLPPVLRPVGVMDRFVDQSQLVGLRGQSFMPDDLHVSAAAGLASLPSAQGLQLPRRHGRFGRAKGNTLVPA